MGYRTAWIARQGTTTEQLLALSERRPTGERHEFADVGWYLLEMPAATPPWVLLLADGTNNFTAISAHDAQGLSADGQEMLYFVCSDTVMVTELRCYRDGREIWAIKYDGQVKNKRLVISGEPPEVVQQTLAKLRSLQEEDEHEDDVYELTIAVGAALTGYRHDCDIDSEDPTPFQVLG